MTTNLEYIKCFFSRCEKYRWSLDLKISNSPKEIIFLGLNPSLSNTTFLDNTTKKIIKISKRYKYGKLKIINLFGLVTKSPKLLKRHKDPIGYLNNYVINKNLKYWSKNINCHLWLGWGNNGILFKRNIIVLKILLKYFNYKNDNFSSPLSPLYIKNTKYNQPIHPLYCPDSSNLIEYW